jgi:hypothetical protein
MRKLFTFSFGGNAQAGLMKDLLEQDGILCVIRNDSLSNLLGEIPFTNCYPELWVIHDQDYPKAKEVLDSWMNQPNQVAASWECPNCGEIIEGQFAACWKCGTEQEELE